MRMQRVNMGELIKSLQLGRSYKVLLDGSPIKVLMKTNTGTESVMIDKLSLEEDIIGNSSPLYMSKSLTLKVNDSKRLTMESERALSIITGSQDPDIIITNLGLQRNQKSFIFYNTIETAFNYFKSKGKEGMKVAEGLLNMVKLDCVTDIEFFPDTYTINFITKGYRFLLRLLTTDAMFLDIGTVVTILDEEMKKIILKSFILNHVTNSLDNVTSLLKEEGDTFGVFKNVISNYAFIPFYVKTREVVSIILDESIMPHTSKVLGLDITDTEVFKKYVRPIQKYDRNEHRREDSQKPLEHITESIYFISTKFINDLLGNITDLCIYDSDYYHSDRIKVDEFTVKGALKTSNNFKIEVGKYIWHYLFRKDTMSLTTEPVIYYKSVEGKTERLKYQEYKKLNGSEQLEYTELVTPIVNLFGISNSKFRGLRDEVIDTLDNGITFAREESK